MTRNKKIVFFLIIVSTLLAGAFALQKMTKKPSAETMQIIQPVIGDIQTMITSTATVQPQNRLEIKPPINGRIDKILVKEGDIVKIGDTLVLMSSTERAALLDAARARGPEDLKYWEDVYKPTPLISPISGEVIVSQDEPGQTVTSADVVLVLSDRLIVQAQVDETDVGKVRIGQVAAISLDAYPQIKVNGKVDHIYYESKIVNNVTIYQVDILPDEVPPVFRSGMTATVNIIEKERNDVLTVPVEAVKKDKDGSRYVLLSGGPDVTPVERKVDTGLSDEKNVEILSGLSADDTVILFTQKYKPVVQSAEKTNPLMPIRRRPAKAK
ncbi:MAG: efflux RND transporter periplasmic adaptor subunit [Candidatus Omnitrophota bacterium]|jgi:macrolide-specific efflux system membrane fusion protein